MAKLMCLFITLAVLATYANALKCYECPAGCDADKSKWTSGECAAPTDTTKKAACLNQVIKAGDQQVVKKKCVFAPMQGDFVCQQGTGETTETCKTCDSDLCNSVGQATLSYVALFSVIVAFLAPNLIH